MLMRAGTVHGVVGRDDAHRRDVRGAACGHQCLCGVWTSVRTAHLDLRGPRSAEAGAPGGGAPEAGLPPYCTAAHLFQQSMRASGRHAGAPRDSSDLCTAGAPSLASHGPNVRCKKTNRATQRTNRLAFDNARTLSL